MFMPTEFLKPDFCWRQQDSSNQGGVCCWICVKRKLGVGFLFGTLLSTEESSNFEEQPAGPRW